MPETGSQQWLFIWADPKNQPCPVEIVVVACQQKMEISNIVNCGGL